MNIKYHKRFKEKKEVIKTLEDLSVVFLLNNTNMLTTNLIFFSDNNKSIDNL